MKNDINQFTHKLTKGVKSDKEKLKRIFYFVRDEIKFDLISDQFTSVENILKIKKGACMNKAILFHDMVKVIEIPVRLHFMEVSKEALEDLLHPLAYKLWPKKFLHTFPEVKIKDKWVPMEPTFDKELHEALLKKRLNFAKYRDRRYVDIEFNIEGVYGAQQNTVIEGSKVVYASNLEPLRKSLEVLPQWKLKLQPFFFKLSSSWINKKVRG